MSFVLTDDCRNVTLAVVGDMALAQFIQHYFEAIGARVKIRIHDSVLCQTYDDDEVHHIYAFEI